MSRLENDYVEQLGYILFCHFCFQKDSALHPILVMPLHQIVFYIFDIQFSIWICFILRYHCFVILLPSAELNKKK